MSISASSPDLVADPLNSPFPIPWRWILDTHAAVVAGKHDGDELYRSPSLYDQKRHFSAYCRVRLQLKPELYQSRVTSTLFVENLHSGMLSTVTATSPLAPHLFLKTTDEATLGTIALLMPVAWSADGSKLLARQFEGYLGSGAMSDYGVIWDSQTEAAVTIAPAETAVDYTHSILLGWSENTPDQVLFQAGCMGEEDWQIWAVAQDGSTKLALADRAMAYGETSAPIWSGCSEKFKRA
ncbi:MAG: hypothetical protein WBB82_15005 [Limnothrix sp.]